MLTQGSHRSGRAHISASGSSTDSFTIHKGSPKLSDRITLTCVKNLDVFNMLPSIESVGRRFAFLHRVLQGEFPCFNGTIKALRLPEAHLAALRFLRLAVPRFHSLFSFPDRRVHCQSLELVTRYLQPGESLRRQQDLPSSWGTLIIRLPCSKPTPAGLLAPDH